MAAGVYASPFFSDKTKVKESIVKHSTKDNIARLERVEKKASAVTKKTLNKSERKNHAFVADNRARLDLEITSLKYVLNNNPNNNPNNEEDWLYLYYCLCLMEKYYAERGQALDEALDPNNPYIIAKNKVKLHFGATHEASNPGLLAKKYLQFSKADKFGFVKDKAMDANLLRLGWVFLRLTVKQSLLLSEELNWLDKIGKFLGKDIKAQDLIDFIEKPNPSLAYASVGLFGIRFLYNIINISTSVLSPAENENRNFTARLNILWREICEKHPELLNDFVWIVINGLSNFPQYSHIAPMVGLYLTAAFLYFDLSLLTWRYYLDYLKYQDKKQQFIHERDILMKQVGDNSNAINTINLQIQALNVEWRGKEAFWRYNMMGAFLLAAGFSATFLIANPMLLPLCFAVCLVGVSMYMTAGTYKDMEQKKAQLNVTDKQSSFFSLRQKELALAKQNHYISLAKHLIMPTLIIGTFLICWQASIALIALFLIVELGTRYLANRKEKNIEIEKSGLALSF